MGVYLSAPVREKVSHNKDCGKYTYGVSSMQGWRVTQEDAHNCISDFDEETNTALYAVYDGHGGLTYLDQMSKYLSTDKTRFLAEKIASYAKDKQLWNLSVATHKLPWWVPGDDGEQSPALSLVLVLSTGAEVAQYTAAHLPDFIKSLPLYKEGKLGDALEDAFLGFDATLTQEDVIKELKTLAGVDDDDDQDDVEDEDGMGRSERELLVAEANMPIEELMAKYKSPSLPHVKSLHKEKHPSSVLKPKKSVSRGAGNDNNIGSDPLVNRQEEKLENGGQPDNDNNLNAEKELQQEAETKTDDKAEVDNIGVNENNSNCLDVNSELTKNGVDDGGCKTMDTNENGNQNCVDYIKSDSSVSSGNESTVVSSTTNEIVSSFKTEISDDCHGVSSSGSGACSSSSGVEEAGGSGVSSCSVSESAEHDGDSSEDEEYNTSDDEEDEYIEESDDEEDEDEYEDDDPELEGGFFGLRSIARDYQDDHNEEPGSDSGCTAVLTLLRNNEVFVANAGDSRCVLCRNGKAMDLSVDHKPEDESELSRITAAGGAVKFGRVNGGLNLSRALGDHWYKRNESKPAREQMISALPDIMTATIEQNDEFLVVACDGIWNCLSSQDVVDFVKERLKDPAKRCKPSIICEEIFDACLAPNTSGDGTGCDNMTCIIIVFNRSEKSAKQDPDGHDSLPSDVNIAKLDTLPSDITSSKRNPESCDTSSPDEMQPLAKRVRLEEAVEDDCNKT